MFSTVSSLRFKLVHSIMQHSARERVEFCQSVKVCLSRSLCIVCYVYCCEADFNHVICIKFVHDSESFNVIWSHSF